ncbi:RNase P modulator RnpM [Veillonella intestinalis]|uniref:RNase P modulator RnpM n=1 Tax=Veillonella intestinalis TaxID=2941341 RepID=UPI002041714A|nr:YlxR family protein [Veillonella intestinalis]
MKKKSPPMRICVGCGELRNKKDMLRIVASPEGVITIDRTGKAAGRGAYIEPKTDCFETAYKAKRLERSLKRAVSADIYENLRAELFPTKE